MKNIWKSNMAVSSVIGISIILTITLLSIGLMILYTAPIISETQDMAKTQKIEQAFTVLDSRTSKASLGESPLQTTSVSLMGENIEVYGNNDSYNESRMEIVFLNSSSPWYTNFYSEHEVWGAWENYENNYSDFAGLNASMGSVRYYLDDRVIAYEGGGVWSRYPDGGTIMTSPPEFHYNGETLTLPIVKVIGNDSVTGSSNVDIAIKSSNTPVILYPNTSTNANFINPIVANKILIYINSDFYDGWAKYAETLTSTTATLDHENNTTIIEMDTEPEMGTFPMMDFEIPAVNYSNPEPFYNFSFYLYTDDSADFFKSSGLKLTVTSGTKTLVYSFNKDGDNVILDKNNNVDTSYAIEYTDSSAGLSEVWETNSTCIFIVNSFKDGNIKNANTTIDFLNDSYLMDYDSIETASSWGSGSSLSPAPNINISYGNANSTQSLNNITQHYLRLIAQDGTIKCSVVQKGNDKIEFDDSTYTLDYDSGGAILNYLHITLNELEVMLN
ncbi:hypothetical protein [Methanolobus vulcani]|uniref:DUF7308 domain-containing protein n=1 Tax=Methanolobus vulcani TaxID=38026 RepID=A0A7Z8KRA6_9EURY|nr:hypothetical protein [Methanolobus vulcani]TQD28252.1 hypothetical protein FKV42_00855 [Methanolobus vulcani]